MHQHLYCNDAKTEEASEATYQIRLYSPHPTIQIIVISDCPLQQTHGVLQRLGYIAKQTAKEFALNPSQVVWLEYLPAQANPLFDAGFNVLNFDWQAGEAISLDRSPLYEDWYL